MIEAIILGTIQGITEWLPLSSEAMIVLAKTHWFGGADSLDQVLRLALWLHLGTFFSVLIYFRRLIWRLLKSLFAWSGASESDKKIIVFLLITSMISGLLGLLILRISSFINLDEVSGRVLTLVIALMLLITAVLQFGSRAGKTKFSQDLNKTDGVLLGLTQGLATIPGLSRSGSTISVLLSRRFKGETALLLSFLMSLPVILGGNIILNRHYFNFAADNLISLLFAFVFGLATIHFLIKLASKINFARFVLLIALLMIVSVLI